MVNAIIECFDRRLRLCGFLLSVGGLAVLAVGGAVADEDRLTALDVAGLRSVGSAKISPDGRYVAYTLSVPRRPYEDEDGPAWVELHVVDIGGRSRPFVAGEVNVSAIEWTPDGRGISFLAKRGEDKEKSLYVIPLDGGEARRVLGPKTGLSSYSWSPDGKRVAYRAAEKDGEERKKLKEKGFKAKVYEEDMRPVRVWVAEIDNEDAEPRALELDGSSHSVSWSPTGEHLMVTLAPTPLIDDRYMRTRVFVVDAESGATVRRFENPGKLGAISWSPDGAHLAIISAEDIHDPSAGRLMVASVADGGMTDVLPNFDGHVRHVGWQDADTIMYVADVHVQTVFGKVDINGSGLKTIIAPGEAVLRSLSMSRFGQHAAYTAESAAHPREVYVMGHGESGPRRMTESNAGLSEKRLAKQEVVSFKARDGLELEGILIYPLDYEPGTRYPLILVVHGGPEGHYSNGWVTGYNAPGQVGAARGFAVFYPNYRGGTGRGVAHSKLGQADYGGREFDDLVDAIGHLVDIGLVDKSKVGITGGSYGGYASAWGATKLTEHFAAAVMSVGISDQVSKAGTTDIPHEMHLVHSQKWPWEDWDWFRERSPIYYVEQARTPILICHGEDDTRVHPSQSLVLHRYLKTLGNVPVRLVLYPGEGHGNRKAAARLDYSLRQMRWMEHYLQGPGGDPPPYALDYGFDDSSDAEEDSSEK